MPGNDAFEIPTAPIAPGRDGRPKLVVVLLVAAVAAAVIIARWSSHDTPDLALPTVGPTLAVAEVEPLATPLPRLQWYTGPEAPLGDVLVEADQIRRLRLASADLDDAPLAQPGRDLLLPVRGGTVCLLCWQRLAADHGDTDALDLVRLDDDEAELSRSRITTVDGLDGDAAGPGPTYVAMEASPDGRVAYLVRAARSATRWRVTLDVIDLTAERVADSVDVIKVARADVWRDTRVDGLTLRVAPDGHHLLVTAEVARAALMGPDQITARAWVVAVDGASIAGVDRADGIVQGSGASCTWIDFVTDALIAQGCQTAAGGPVPALAIHRHDLRGGDLGTIDVDPWPADGRAPLIDATRGIVYGWDPEGHRLRAIDVAGGVQAEADTTGAEGVAPDAVEIVGPRPDTSIGSATIWADGRSATEARGEQTVVGSPDGELLFAIGAGADGRGSSGVWVFDAQHLALIERWPALAAYGSLTLFENGRWLAAIGQPGLTATGDRAAWGTSLTIHDARSGRPVLRIGDLRTDGAVTFAWSQESRRAVE